MTKTEKLLQNLENVRDLAEKTLTLLESMQKSSIYASRKDICAGVNKGNGMVIMFRHVVYTVRMEIWQYNKHNYYPIISIHTLPCDLEKRAAALLDSLV